MNNVVLLLGSNQGVRENHIANARFGILNEIGTVTAASSVYETAPWGNTDQGPFLNQVIVAETQLDAERILQRIFAIENGMGRVRTKKWESRIIDIDILFFNHEVIKTNDLVIPHPSIQLRKFTLVPLNEIMPGYIHPVLSKTVATLLKELNDPLEVKQVSADYHPSF
jgi:2-amino-4-hydroxy-6-hydroxymethyldihydropteridine diphosphokinase